MKISISQPNSKIGLISLTISLIATQIGIETLISSKYNSSGYFNVLYALASSVAILLLGSGFIQRLEEFKVSSAYELFEKCYDSIIVRRFAYILYNISWFGALVSQIIALKYLLSEFGINQACIFPAFWIFIVVYAALGKLKTITNILQIIFGISLATRGAIFLYNIFYDSSILQNVINISKPQLLATHGIDSKAIMQVFLPTLLFSLIEPNITYCFFVAKTKRISMLSAILASLFLISFSLTPTLFDIKTHMLVPVNFSKNMDLSILNQLSQNILAMLAMCSMLFMIICTAYTYIDMISSNVISILNLSDNKKLTASIDISMGLLALICVYTVPTNILYIFSYQMALSCTLVPLLFCYFTKSLSKNSANLSMILGFVGFVLFNITGISFCSVELATLSLSLLGYLIGMIL